MKTKGKLVRTKRIKLVKRSPRYTASPTRITPPFEVLHAAHRGKMGAAVAAAAADQLRSVAQVMMLASDTAKRRGEVPPKVSSAIAAADQMLAHQISELERFGGEVPLGPVDVDDVLQRVANLTREWAGPAVKIVVHAADPIAPARTNAVDLSEIIFALLRNSCEALGKKGGRVHVTTAQNREEVRVVVQDDGPGLTPNARRHLFEPYVRPRTDGSTLGLGLMVSRELARQHGGDLVYEGRQGRGARFVLTAPRWISPRRVRRSPAAG